MAEPVGGALMPRAAALAGPDGSVLLVCGESESDESALVAALVDRGHTLLAEETTVLDPETLEVRLPASEPPEPNEPLEVRLLVALHHDADSQGVRTTHLPGGEAAHLVGSRCVLLEQVEGGPLPALARLARRVPVYRVRYADERLAAEEVIGLWRET